MHRHSWNVHSHDNKTMSFLCERCHETVDIGSKDPVIRKVLKKLAPTLSGSEVHLVWREFEKRFKVRVNVGTPVKVSWQKKPFQNYRLEYRLTGFELMEALDEWAKKHPDTVRIASCDDDHFMGSSLVYILHQSPTAYMGATVVYVPQNSVTPTEYFLYPGHVEDNQQALSWVTDASKLKRKPRPEIALYRELNRYIRKIHP